MNILVVGGGSWDDTTSLGNTFSNLFAGWEDANIYNLFFRDTEPNNSVCNDYFRITTKEILLKYFAPHKIGTPFRVEGPRTAEEKRKGEMEKKAISLIHRYGLKWVYELEDMLWSSKKWQNKKLDRFIAWVKPDIIFSFAAGNSYMILTTEYIKRKTNAKLVLLVADDLHTTYRLAKDRHHRRMQKALDRQMELADKVYGISQEMCDYYTEIYCVDIVPLYKGCSFEYGTMRAVNQPIKLFYAGNLLFGRLETLIALADSLEKLNSEKIVAVLDIYSGTIISDEDREKLNHGQTARFHGGIDYLEVKRRMADADIVLHIESFDKEQIRRVRYSFSTKIMDCLQSGRVMLAIGPRGLSSIEYPRRIPGAVVIDDVQQMYDRLRVLLAEKEGLIERAEQIRRFALSKHNIDSVRRSLQNEFRYICAENKK